MAEGNRELIEGAYEAFGRGDIPGVLGILSDDVEWSVPEFLPQGMHVRGRDGVAGFFENLGKTWDGLSVQVDDFVASGDRVCAIGTASGTTGGTDVSYGFVHAWTVRDGAAARFDEYVDPPAELVR
jgi:ketosteroid isomerase-like protein